MSDTENCPDLNQESNARIDLNPESNALVDQSQESNARIDLNTESNTPVDQSQESNTPVDQSQESNARVDLNPESNVRVDLNPESNTPVDQSQESNTPVDQSQESNASVEPEPEGPVTRTLGTKTYLEEKRIPVIFECLLAAMMLECPDDHLNYVDDKISLMKELGVENVVWDMFITHLHPTMDPVRLKLIQEEEMLKAKKGYDPMIVEETYYSSMLSEQVMYEPSKLPEKLEPIPKDGREIESDDEDNAAMNQFLY